MTQQKLAFEPHKISALRALNDEVVVMDMEFAERISHGGIILMNDDMKSAGIRPRWAQVYAVGPEQTTVKVGQWVCTEHGRWTRGVKIEDETGTHTIRRVDPDCILLISDTKVEDSTMTTKMLA